MLVAEQIVKEKYPGATMTKEINDGLFYVLDLGDNVIKCPGCGSNTLLSENENEDENVDVNVDVNEEDDILGCETSITFIEDEEGLEDYSGPKEGDRIIHYDNLEVLGIGDTKEEAWRDALYSITSLN